MAQAPYSEGIPSVEPQVGVPNRYLDIPSTPAEFGGLIGRGEEEAGAGALKAGRFYGQVAADQATNNWSDDVNKLLYGDPTTGDLGVYGLKGQAGMDAAATVGTKISALRDKYRNQLLTPEQQLTFDQYTRRMQNYLTGEIGRHYDNQAQLWAEAENKRSEDRELSFISSHAEDEEQFRQGYANLFGSRLKELHRTSGDNISNEDMEITKLEARRDATFTRIRAIAPKNPELAKVLFDQADQAGLFKGTPQYDALANMIEAHGDRAAADRALQNALGPAGAGGGNLGGIGTANYAKRSGALGDANAPNFEAQHITSISSPSGVTFRVNKAAASDFSGFLKDLEGTGYKINQEDSGGYNKRNIAGTNTLSEHAYGNAIDINASGNPSLAGANLKTDLPANIRQIAATHNLTWGGDWHDLKDAMHFEWTGPRGGAATARNNPGNIKAPGGGLASYPTPEAGIQAIGDWLQRHQSQNNLTTIRQLIDDPKFGYAPSSDNLGKTLPEDAAAFVFGSRDAADRPIDMGDPGMRQKMTQAIIRQEGVKYAQAGPITMNDAGQQALANGKPDYAAALARLNADTTLSPRAHNEAMSGLRQRYTFEHELEQQAETAADKVRKDAQATMAADLFAKAVNKEPLDQRDLADKVRTRQITEQSYNAIMSEVTKAAEPGQNDWATIMHLEQRMGAGEDVSADIEAAAQHGALKGEMASQLLGKQDTIKKSERNQVERAYFSSLRTVVGMDATEHPMIDLEGEAKKAQVQLWGQAQNEWNTRVLIGKESPPAVFADMAPRYGHTSTSISALPSPRSGPIQKVEDVQLAKQKTSQLLDQGLISADQFQADQELIVRYQQYFDVQAKSAAELKARQTTGGGARAVGVKPAGE